MKMKLPTTYFRQSLGQSLVLMTAVIGMSAQAANNPGPASFTYEGRVTDSVGNPAATTVVLTLNLYDANGTCLLRSEQMAPMDLSATSGYFSVNVGQGTLTAADPGLGYTLTQIFSNSAALNGTSCTYTPVAGDGRRLRVTLNDGTNTVALTPDVAIGATPFSMVANTLQGHPPADFVSVNTTTAQLSQANLEAVFGTTAKVTEMQNLANASSTVYVKAAGTGGATIPSYAGTPSSPAAGQFWYDTTANKLTYWNGTSTQALAAAGGGTVTSVTAGAGLSGGPITSMGSLSLATVGTSGTYSKVTTDVYGRVTSGSALASTDISSLAPLLGGSTNGTSVLLGTNDAFPLSLRTSSTTRVQIDQNGNVGIGNTSPATRLHVTGTVILGDGAETCSATYAGGIRYNSATVQYCNGTSWLPLAAGSAGTFLTTSGGTMSGALAVTAGMSVSGALALSGAMTSMGSVNIANGTSTTSPTTGALVVGGGVGIGGAMSISGPVIHGSGTASGPAMTFGADTTTGIYMPGAGAMGFSTGGVPRMMISTAGNIGIGTTSPAYPLDVAGNINTNTRYFINGNYALAMPSVNTNIAVGYNASPVVTGGWNTAVGYNSLLNGTTSQSNTAFGAFALSNTSTGSNNTAVGYYALKNATSSGGYNTALGTNAGSAITTGNYNIAIGTGTASGTLSTGFSNILVGYYADTPSASTSSFLDIGNLIFATNMNGTLSAPAGNVGIGTISPAYRLDVVGDISASGCLRSNAGVASGSCVSDARLKTEVQDFGLGLDALMGISPKYFRYNGLGEHPASPQLELGVIAQEVEKTAPSLVSTRQVKLRPDDRNLTTVKQVNYSAFTYMTINAIKELYQRWSTESAAKEARIQALEQENALIKFYLCEKEPTAAFCH